MIDTTSLENALRAWIVEVVSSLEVVFAMPGMIRPTTAYALINIYSVADVSAPESTQTLQQDLTTNTNLSKLCHIAVSINTFYTNAFYNAILLKHSLERRSITEDLWAAGLGFIKAGDVQKVNQVIEKQWEERAQFDCFFSCRSLDVDNVQIIDQVRYTNLDGQSTLVEKPT